MFRWVVMQNHRIGFYLLGDVFGTAAIGVLILLLGHHKELDKVR